MLDTGEVSQQVYYITSCIWENKKFKCGIAGIKPGTFTFKWKEHEVK